MHAFSRPRPAVVSGSMASASGSQPAFLADVLFDFDSSAVDPAAAELASLEDYFPGAATSNGAFSWDDSHATNDARQDTQTPSALPASELGEPALGNDSFELQHTSCQPGVLWAATQSCLPSEGEHNVTLSSRKRRTQEKNRRAQQTYRDKQKKRLTAISSSLQELTVRVERLEQEKADLEQKKADLELQNINLLEQTITLQSYNGMALQTTPRRGAAVKATQAFWLLVLPEDACRLALDGLSWISVADFRRCQQAYRLQLTELLSGGAGDPQTAAHCQLERMVSAKRKHALHILMDSDPALMLKLKAAWSRLKKETAERHGPPSEELWTTVLAALNLSSEQRKRLVDSKAEVARELEELVQDRHKILGSFVHIQDASKGAIDGYAQACSAAARLASNIERERRLVLRSRSGILSMFLTPLQEARGIVAAHPHWLDIHALYPLLERH